MMHLHLSKSGIATCYISQSKPVISDFQEERCFLADSHPYWRYCMLCHSI